jgi:hypothetical protein
MPVDEGGDNVSDHKEDRAAYRRRYAQVRRHYLAHEKDRSRKGKAKTIVLKKGGGPVASFRGRLSSKTRGHGHLVRAPITIPPAFLMR